MPLSDEQIQAAARRSAPGAAITSEVLGPEGGPGPSGMGLWEGLIKSALHGGTVGLVGVEATGDLGRWQAQNPWKSLGAELVGSIPAYAFAPELAPIRLLEGVPLLNRAWRTVELGSEFASRSPSLAFGAREALRFAPFEVARLGGSAVAEATGKPGTEDAFSRTLFSAPIELGLIGGGATGLSRLAQMRPFAGAGAKGEAAILERVPGAFALDDTPQAKIAALRGLQGRTFEGLSGAETQNLESLVNEAIALNMAEVLGQAPPKRWVAGILRREPAVRGLEGGDADATAALDDLFRPGVKADIARTERLSFGDGMPRNFPAGWEANVQFPRRVRALPGQEVRLQRSLEELIPEVAPGTHLGREVGSGLWVGARREAPDSWVIFKTAEPRIFHPSTVGALEREAYALGGPPGPPPSVADVPAFAEAERLRTAGMMETPRLEGVQPSALRQATLERLPPRVRAGAADLTRGLRTAGSALNRFLAPRATVLAKSPRAVAIARFAESMARGAEERASRLFFGDVVSGGMQEGLRGLSAPAVRSGGLDRIIGSLRQGSEAHRQFNAAWYAALTPGEAASRGYAPEVLQALRAIHSVDRQQAEMISRVQAAYPEVFDFNPRDVHYMLSRMWKGNLRAPLFAGDPRRILGYASGSTPAEVERDFRALQRFIQERGGPLLQRGEVFQAGRETDIARARKLVRHGLQEEAAPEIAKTMSDLQSAMRLDTTSPVFRMIREQRLSIHEPARFQRRRGAIGFRGTTDLLPIQDIQRAIYSNIIEGERLVAQLATREAVMPAFQRLRVENPTLARDVSDFVHQLYGGRSEFNQRVAAAIDKPLAPFFGSESASKITQVANRTMYNVTLGFLDLGAPALNLSSILTQALPELAIVRGGLPERLASSYSWNLVRGATGMHQLGVLDAGRLLRRGWTLLRNPTPEFRAALHENTAAVAPKMYEEFSGELAGRIVGIREVARGEASLSRYMLALNEFLMAKSEELARMMSFSLGWIGGREFLNLGLEDAGRFAAQFTKRTMYGYSTADRSRIITGPLGTPFGLFKNWGLHNIAQSMRYGRDAFLHGEWRPFLWMMGSLTAVGGLGSVPLIGAADAMSRIFAEKSLVENLYTWFGKSDDEMGEEDHWFLDTFYFGLPAFLGITVQNRAAAPGSDMVRDVGQMMSFLTLDRMQYLSKAVGQAMDYWETSGRNPFEDPRTRQLLTRALAPRSVYRAAALTADTYLRSYNTGSKIAGPISAAEYAAYIFGFEPVQLAKQYEANEIQFGEQEQARELTRKFGTAFAGAITQGSREAQDAVIAGALASKVPLQSMMSSARTRLRNQAILTTERSFDLRRSEGLRRVLGYERRRAPQATQP